MQVIFEASEAQYEAHEETGVPPISLTQPSRVIIDVPAYECPPFVQITYATCRTAPNGDDLAYYTDGFWQLAPNLVVVEAGMLDGSTVDAGAIQTRDMVFTDIIITNPGLES